MSERFRVLAVAATLLTAAGVLGALDPLGGGLRLRRPEAGGVQINGSHNTIGGFTAGERNIISGQFDFGVRIAGQEATGNFVHRNYIGTNAGGTFGKFDLGNSDAGVILNGPDNWVERNVISGNGHGVQISRPEAHDNTVWGNFIGTDKSGTKALGNRLYGVRIENASGNYVGKGNTIAFSGLAGVGIQAWSATTDQNFITSNSIHSNGQLGIDLNIDGVSPNDPGDGDGGVNFGINFPVLTSAQTSRTGVTTVTGTLDSSGNDDFTVQFFSSPRADPSGHGEDKRFLGEKPVTTDPSGDAAFVFKTRKNMPKGTVLTATASSADHGCEDGSCRPPSTSEFTQAIAVRRR